MAFLVNSNLHYSFVETKGFQHFVSVTNQKYNVKSSRTMSKQIAPLLYKKLNKAMHEVLQKELPECHNVAFTYNTWDRLQIRDEEKEEEKPILSVYCPCLSTTSTNILNSEKLLFLLTLGCIPVKMTLQLRWMRGRAALLVLMIINNKLIFFKVLLIYNEQLVNICFNTWRSRSFSLINHTHHEI
jgi:hypothetical protein